MLLAFNELPGHVSKGSIGLVAEIPSLRTMSGVYVAFSRTKHQILDNDNPVPLRKFERLKECRVGFFGGWGFPPNPKP